MPVAWKTKATWKKLGLIFRTPETPPWMMTHAANSFVETLGNGNFRVFFSCRDVTNRASIACFDFNISSPHDYFNLSTEPVLTFGQAGMFDDSGTSMASIVKLDDGTRYLYYIGWNLGVTVPWRNSIGLAIAEPGSDKFEKFSLAPIVDRNAVDPFSLSYPWVMRRSKNDWLMWYGSNLSWGADERDMQHIIKFARSEDGIDWQRDGKIAINIESEDEYAFARPCVLYEDGKFRMWYSFRGEYYKLGYAESNDGIDWTRLDERVGIDRSPENDWESRMISYPCVFPWDGKFYLLYNGNDYGKSGIGIAVLD